MIPTQWRRSRSKISLGLSHDSLGSFCNLFPSNLPASSPPSFRPFTLLLHFAPSRASSLLLTSICSMLSDGGVAPIASSLATHHHLLLCICCRQHASRERGSRKPYCWKCATEQSMKPLQGCREHFMDQRVQSLSDTMLFCCSVPHGQSFSSFDTRHVLASAPTAHLRTNAVFSLCIASDPV